MSIKVYYYSISLLRWISWTSNCYLLLLSQTVEEQDNRSLVLEAVTQMTKPYLIVYLPVDTSLVTKID